MDRENRNNKGTDIQNALNIAKKYRDVVSDLPHFNELWLFGSFVRGDFHKDSDLDIAVIFDNYQSKMDIQLELMRLRRNIDSRIEPHPFRKVEFNSYNPLIDEIKKYGKVIS
ncbi:nucleotidyltransferase domain-containing protein [Marivirga sp.]|uniref:nucleotidyltransferase domain-containing protein n=1 Tax=Marivirga sp. TaxID=2018662 RepID=UPI0025D6BE86|nr:nucleotidyltransferase domain-containing protein [Marivirga sp.]